VILFELCLEICLDEMQTVSDDNNVCIAGMHLIERVHHVRVGFVSINKQKDNCLFLMALSAVDESYRTVFHLTRSESLGVNII